MFLHSDEDDGEGAVCDLADDGEGAFSHKAILLDLAV